MPLNKSWNYNESLIELVSVLIYVSFPKPSNKDVIKLSNGKVGASFHYSNSYRTFL